VHSDDGGNDTGSNTGYGAITGSRISAPYPSTQSAEYPMSPAPGQFQATVDEPYPAPSGTIQYPAGEQFPGTTEVRP
jgi:hypothetical protein